MRHRFQSEQWVPYSRERVFAFFADPGNLSPLMPAWQHTRADSVQLVQPPFFAGSAAGQGSTITISFRPVPLVPVRLTWEAYIAEFRANEFFCDEQRRGPFRYFRHCHRLRDENGGTVVQDDVEYELPLGPLGDLANGLVVRRQIAALFAHRQRMLLQLLAEG